MDVFNSRILRIIGALAKAIVTVWRQSTYRVTRRGPPRPSPIQAAIAPNSTVLHGLSVGEMMQVRLARLDAAVQALPEPGRSIFRDHCMSGLAYAEIARTRGLSVLRVQLELADVMVTLTSAEIGRCHE